MKPLRYMIWDELVSQIKRVPLKVRWVILVRRMEVFNYYRDEAAEELLAEPRLEPKVAAEVLRFLGEEKISQQSLEALMRRFRLDHRMVMKLLLWSAEQLQEPPELTAEQLKLVEAAYERACENQAHRRSYIQMCASYAFTA
ncbi:hypothetical protein IT411_01075 [Candidatus Peregrinibacteria bacterium]|nr:hypothetical protein [Candidatus Peregrinibacteria bacterium]